MGRCSLAEDFIVGPIVGKCTILNPLGRGGMGAVYRATSQHCGPVAIKVVEAGADDGSFRERFRHEITALKRIRGSHVAEVIDADSEAPRPWLAMQLINGADLGNFIRRDGPLDPDRVIDLIGQLAQALESIHGARIIHRDLKPSNVLVESDGRVVVIDFGIAVWDGATHLTRTGQAIGTVAFLSPEQARGESASFASDVFALGATAYYAATGDQPFGSGTSAETLARVTRAKADLRMVPDGRVADLLAACLDVDPAKRPTPSRLRELAEAARCQHSRPFRDDTPTTVRARPAAEAEVPKNSRRGLILIAAMVCLLVAGTIGGVFWWKQQAPAVAATLAATATTFPRGDAVTITWADASISGGTTALRVDAQPPPASCPDRIDRSGSCTFKGTYSTTYEVSLVTNRDGSEIGRTSTSVRTYPQPSISVGPGSVVTDPVTDQKGCAIEITARGLAPRTAYTGSLMTRNWESQGEAPHEMKAAELTDDEGNLRDVVLKELLPGGPREWAYGQRDGWVRIILATLSATKDPWGCP